MTAKEYLLSGRQLDVRIRLDLKQIDNLHELSTSVSGSGFERSYNPNHPIEAPFEKCISEISEMEEKIRAEVRQLIEVRNRMISTIRMLSDADCQSVLELRYIHYMSWEDIAGEMHYSLRWICRLHGRALAALDEILEEHPDIEEEVLAVGRKEYS